MVQSQKIGPYTVQVLDSDTNTVSIRKQLMSGNKMLVRPAADWQSFSWSEQRMLLHETATFVAPTEELVDWLDQTIGEESAIEICCGNGWIGRELGIPITDSKVHDRKDVALLYAMFGNPRIKYPRDVRPFEAQQAVKHFHPHTVIACYPAFKWEPSKQIGSDYGVDFIKLLRSIKRLIIVGNDHIHGDFALMDIPHQTIHIPGLITRNQDRAADNIYVWEN